MSCGKVLKKTIVEIFNEMIYEEKTCESEECGDCSHITEQTNIHRLEVLKQLNQLVKITREPKSFDNAVEIAVKAQSKWKNQPALKRANLMHKVWNDLKDLSKMESKFKKDFTILLNFFDFFSNLSIQMEEYKNWRPYGVVLIVLPHDSAFFFLASTVPAALAIGCSVVVLANEKSAAASLCLEEILTKASLQDGLFNVVTDFDENNIPVSKKISKTLYFGTVSSAQKYYSKTLTKSFSFYCPNSTSAFILDSCDLNAAVEKIVSETWTENSLFGVSNVFVQENTFAEFIEKLKNKMEHFIMENKSSLHFKDKTLSDKINTIISEALRSGATVESTDLYDNEWSPTLLINYQNQDIEENLPILRIHQCRTAKEGVSLLNNTKICLGVSIWSEVSSQALEISSALNCPNIWINCHGVYDASEPLQLSGFSGDCVLGGSDSILEYMSFRLDDPVEATKNIEDKLINVEKEKVLQLATAAMQTFNIWKHYNNKRKYIKEIAAVLEDNKEFSKLAELISNLAHYGSFINFSEGNSTHEFSVVKKKIPLGVIMLLVNSSTVELKTITSLIIPAIILGNAVILVLKDENTPVKNLIKNFNNVLPKNLLNVTMGVKAGLYLASDPNIKAIWLYDESTVTNEFLQTIKNHSEETLKHIWVIPKTLTLSRLLFQKECLQTKITWLTKQDQFP